MSDLLPLKTGIIYGPVCSRRLGRSLGINLLPPGRKWCPFDCLYCHYGWTPPAAAAEEDRPDWPPVEAVARALEAALRDLAEPPAYLTFSGNGEPTLHPDFPRVAEAVIGVRDRFAPESRLALLSNSSRAADPDVGRAIRRIDRPIMKLDAGNEAVFRIFNRPVPGVDYVGLVTGLKAISGITIQSLFAAGPMGNIGKNHIRDWLEIVGKIRPRDVQVYTIGRPVPSEGVSPAPRDSLLDILAGLGREGIRAEVF